MYKHHFIQPADQRWTPGRTPGHYNDGAGAPVQAVARRPSARLDGKRILIVEDEALLAMDMQFAFEDEGAEVLGPALSLEQALEMVRETDQIDGAILDVDLQGREVYPVATRLRDAGVPIVFHTGHGSRIQLAEMFPGSVTCSKPTLTETLISTLLRLSH